MGEGMVIKICVDLRNVKRINYKYVVLVKMSVIIDTHVFSEYMLTLCFTSLHEDMSPISLATVVPPVPEFGFFVCKSCCTFQRMTLS